MHTDPNKHLSGTSREAEEQHLKETLQVIHRNVSVYGKDVARMRDEIDDMLEHFHDDNPELINTLENTITMYENLNRALERNEKARKKPYFGRIVFRDETYHKDESLYIGRGGIARDATTLEVVDWRAPVANAYYENGLGKCSYKAPDGKEIDIDLQLKRTYEIEDGKLLNFFDTEVISNDELLTKYLSKNKEAVLGEIVATIQQEQNEIIRKSPYHNVIVQGVAGSGKTTVAMHRISYILYNYQARFKPEDFYIVGSNRILLNYITGILPDLDVHGVRQMTMEQLFIRLLYEDWDDKKYRIKPTDQSGRNAAVKGSLTWFYDLENYCNRMEWETICREDIYLKEPKKGEHSVLLVEGSSVEQYILQNPTISLQTKINTLNERLMTKIQDEFLGKIRYTENDKKAILKAHRGTYGAPSWKKSIFSMYEDFIAEQFVKGFEVEFAENEFDVYDLAALAYLYKRIKETEVISEAHHVVIDEAQDYGMMAYSVLKFCIKDCTYTIMGDVSQNIHFGYGLNDWEELKKLFLSTDRASFNVLKKSYRNTVEISGFATEILHHGQFSVYPVEPIIRHGEPVRVEAMSNSVIAKAAEICKQWQKKGLATIAVICRNQKEAAIAAKELSKHIDILDSNPEYMDFGNGIMVLPVEYTKGLEFDAVLILNPTKEAYPLDDGHAKLLYVAATRALHELCVLHSGDLTRLIAEAAPKKEPKEFAADPVEPTTYYTAHPVTKPSVSGVRPKPTLVKPSIAKPSIAKPKAVKNESGTAFGDIPATELLRPSGHSKIDLAVQWVSKQPDGIYLQSKYGVLRISPVRSDIVRITFAKGNQIAPGKHPKINPSKTSRACGYKESSKMLEFVTDELYLQVDKTNGAIRYMTRDKKLLLEERNQECRQIDITPKGMVRGWHYMNWQKEEHIFGHRIGDKLGQNLRKTARYISHGDNSDDLPLLISDKGYGIVIASDGPAFACDIVAYGSYLYVENIKQLDYYFIVGKDTNTILSSYEFLKGTM